MAIVFALIAFFGWGVGDTLMAVLSRKIGNLKANLILSVGSFLVTSLYIPFAGGLPDIKYLIFAYVIALANNLGTVYYFRGFEKANVSLVGTISSSYSAVTVFISVLFFKEILNFYQVIGIIFVILGIIFSSINLKELLRKDMTARMVEKSFFYGIVPMFVWGIYFAVVRIPVEKIGWFWTAYCLNFFFIILLGFRKVKIADLKIVFSTRSMIILVLVTIFILNIALFAVNLGITYGYTSVVATIAGAYPILIVILSRIIFNELLSASQKIGIIFTLVGIVILGGASG